jgi:hypothetical protein
MPAVPERHKDIIGLLDVDLVQLVEPVALHFDELHSFDTLDVRAVATRRSVEEQRVELKPLSASKILWISECIETDALSIRVSQPLASACSASRSLSVS